MKIGLTGGIGTGKSTALGFFNKHGCCTLSTDQIVHELYTKDQDVMAELCDAFGSAAVADGRVDRVYLASRVFNDPEARKQLESIVHPRVRERWMAFVQSEGNGIRVVEIPLLFEKKLEKHFDYTVMVYSEPSVRVQRLKKRNMDKRAIEARMRTQLNQDQAVKLSNFVIHNNGSLDFLEKQVVHCMDLLKAKL